MTPLLYGVARALVEAFDPPGPVLQVGSLLVEAGARHADPRPLFPGKPYEGIDIRPGPGVDRVADAEALPHADGTFGTVLSMSTFEHVRHFWKAFAEVRRVLRPDGVFLVSCPFNVRIHAHPCDYWRFTADAFEVLLADDYPHRVLGWHGPADRPENVWALAAGPAHPGFRPEQFTRYQELLGRYARQPLRWRRALRYRFIAWLDGRGLCAPFLDRERIHTELRAA